MCLLAGQDCIIGALLCTSGFLHPRHCTVPCLYHAERVSFWKFQSWIRQKDQVPQDGTKALCMDCSTKEQAGHHDQEDCGWLWPGNGTVHQTLRLCGQRVHVVCGVWQMFLPTENCVFHPMFLRQTACHRGWSPLLSPLPSLFPKLPNLMPSPQPRVQPNLLPRWQPSLQPSLQLESPFRWSLLSMRSPSVPPEKVAHRACLSVKLNMYPNKQFLAHFVVHMPLCLHVLFCVAGPLHSNRGGGGGP